MPPVADDWDMAIRARLKANKGTGRPESLRKLYPALAAHHESNQNAGSWQKTIKRVRKGLIDPEEETVAVIVAVLGGERSDYPARKPVPTKRELDRRLAQVEVGIGAHAEETARNRRALGSLGRRIDALEDRLEQLENGAAGHLP